jgi:APA family basic amino acid/polyamine antiporter
MKKGILAKKSIGALLKEASDSRHGLKRALGPVNLTAMGIGAVIGAGLFLLTGAVAAKFAGPGVVFSYMIAAAICVFAALCYAEFASLIPIAGSAYTYAYVTMGEFFAWLLGLALTLEYLFSFSTVAVGWSGYFVSLMRDLGVDIPFFLAQGPFMYDAEQGWVVTGALINIPAMVIIAVIGWLVSRGIQMAAFLNNLLVFVKLGIILIFIGCGLAFINGDNWIPMIPENTGVFGEFGWSGVFRGAGIVFFAFLGFDAISTLAQEARNPQRDMPIGMLSSLGICAFLYIVFGFVLTGVVSYTTLGVSDPIVVAVHAFGPQFAWLKFVVSIAILAGFTSVILVMIMALARVLYTMAHDGLLPPAFGRTHPKYRTPFFTTMAVSAVGMGLAGIFPVDILGQLTSMGALFIFGMVCFGVLILRFTQPHLHRPFKTPFTPWVPLIGALACFGLMFLMPSVTWLQMIGFMGVGSVVYFIYGRHHSKVSRP